MAGDEQSSILKRSMQTYPEHIAGLWEEHRQHGEDWKSNLRIAPRVKSSGEESLAG
jgi:hypothetical protein